MKEKSCIPIQTALMPLYYKDFRCIMGACQDNCCDDGWKIEFSKKDYLKVKRVPKSPELEQRMNQCISRLREESHDGKYAEIKLDQAGRCAFHTKEGLCSLQLECGEDVLPKVCRRFPRRAINGPAGRELSLSPACEGVLSLLWNLPDGIDFWEEPLSPKDQFTVTVENPLYTRFADIRALCVDVLQERSLRLPQRLLLLGFLLQKLQKLDWETCDDVDSWLTQGEMFLHDPILAKELNDLPGNKQMFLIYNHETATKIMLTSKLERANVAHQLCDAIKATVPGKEGRTILDVQRYRELEQLLRELVDPEGYFFENLMVSAMFYQFFPNLKSPEKLWQGYVQLCGLYSLYRFAAVCGCAREVSQKRLFHVLASMSRATLHSPVRRGQILSQLFQNESTTLAHMAILVNG